MYRPWKSIGRSVNGSFFIGCLLAFLGSDFIYTFVGTKP